MKVAITGKGGVGKTTVTALLARTWQRQGRSVVAVDADPDANLAGTLGHRGQPIAPLAQMRALVSERVGGQGWDAFLRMNPKVDDIPEQCGVMVDGIRVLVMGTIDKGLGGCACPENVLLREVLSHLVLGSGQHVVVDMEAGIEHLGRGTAQGVDAMLVVVEPGWASLETAQRVVRLASDLGVPCPLALANKVTDHEDLAFVQRHLAKLKLLGALPFDRGLERDAREGRPTTDPAFLAQMAQMARKLEHVPEKGDLP